MKQVVIAFGAMVLMTGCASREPVMGDTAAAPVDASSPLAAPTYVAMAASSDQFEIQSGQLAAQMSQNPAIRGFGNMLVAHHTHTTNQLVAAAQSVGLAPPPPVLMPNHQAMLDQLRAAGPNFDVAFRDIQVQAHQEALALHQNYAAGGDQPPLRTVAAAAVPIIQQHLTAAQGLNASAMSPAMSPANGQMAPEAAPQSSGERG